MKNCFLFKINYHTISQRLRKRSSTHQRRLIRALFSFWVFQIETEPTNAHSICATSFLLNAITSQYAFHILTNNERIKLYQFPIQVQFFRREIYHVKLYLHIIMMQMPTVVFVFWLHLWTVKQCTDSKRNSWKVLKCSNYLILVKFRHIYWIRYLNCYSD